MIMEKQAPEYRRLSDWVVGRIIAALREGLLLPGQVLVERDLAEMLSVSRQPVRDGLRTLEHLGVVVSEGRKTYVRSWLPVDVADTQVIMNELTLLALRLAAPRISDDDIAELRKIAEESRSRARSRLKRLRHPGTARLQVPPGHRRGEQQQPSRRDDQVAVRTEAGLRRGVSDRPGLYEVEPSP